MKPLILLLLCPLLLLSQQLSTADRLLVRESQLQVTQAYLARAQADANIAKAEASLTQLVMSLKEKYGCKGDCTLGQNLIFIPPPPEVKPEAPSSKSPQAAKPEAKPKEKEK